MTKMSRPIGYQVPILAKSLLDRMKGDASV